MVVKKAQKIITIVKPDAALLYKEAATHIGAALVGVCAAQGYCRLGIVGGRSIAGILDALVKQRLKLKGKLEVVWVDERVETEKIYVEALPFLEKLRTQGILITWHPLTSTNQKEIVAQGSAVIAKLAGSAQSPALDVVILSSGEDGHVGALVPHHKSLQVKTKGYVVEPASPKPPALRITMTPPLLMTAKYAFIFFVGQKQEAYDAFLDKKKMINDCPAKLVYQIPNTRVFTCLD